MPSNFEPFQIKCVPNFVNFDLIYTTLAEYHKSYSSTLQLFIHLVYKISTWSEFCLRQWGWMKEMATDKVGKKVLNKQRVNRHSPKTGLQFWSFNYMQNIFHNFYSNLWMNMYVIYPWEAVNSIDQLVKTQVYLYLLLLKRL